jgi:hypothetical protein
MLHTMAIRGPKWFIIAALVTMAPDTPGVFELWEDDELVFVGSSRDSTLRSQLVHDLLESRCDATHFSWEITYHPAARERELLAEFEREHHHPPRLNSRA